MKFWKREQCSRYLRQAVLRSVVFVGSFVGVFWNYGNNGNGKNGNGKLGNGKLGNGKKGNR